MDKPLYEPNHGLNLKSLQAVCSIHYGMPPEKVRSLALSLYDKKAISYPLTEETRFFLAGHGDGERILRRIGELKSPSYDWGLAIERAEPRYLSCLWTTDKPDHEAIHPTIDFNQETLSDGEFVVFGIIAEHYIDAFDPERAEPFEQKSFKIEQAGEMELMTFRIERHKVPITIGDMKTVLEGPMFVINTNYVRFSVVSTSGERAHIDVRHSLLSSYFSPFGIMSAVLEADFIVTNMKLFQSMLSRIAIPAVYPAAADQYRPQRYTYDNLLARNRAAT